MKFRYCKESDFQEVQRLLKDAGLPFVDITEHKENIEIAEGDNLEINGIGALEIFGKTGLFRSLVVAADKRNRKMGTAIYKRIECKARNAGVKELYLLTENACKYFENLGFIELVRNEVPIEIRDTSQFSSLCPASAKVMRKYL